MAGFYYFFKNRRVDEIARGEELDVALLTHYGLHETLADVRKVPLHATLSNVGSNAGPGNSCGALLVIGSKYTGAPDIVTITHPKDLQKWVCVNEEKGLWLGVLKADPPRPQDLERFKVIGGGTVTDPQHYEWTLPVARALAHGMPYGTLPQSYRFDEQGEPQPVLDKAYEWLWNLAGEVKDWYVASDSENRRPHAWLVKTAAKLLGVNYRVGIPELNLLQEVGRSVLHQQTVGAICQACYGWEVLEEAKKNSSPAETASTEIPTAAS